jgi:acetolactate synthase-1/3 small subunit
MNEKNHIIVILVEDQPNVMTKIPGLFSRRGFNIETITVGKSKVEGLSKITLTVFGDDKTIEQVLKQLNKLVDVVKVLDMSTADSIRKELCLLRLKTKTREAKDDIIRYANIYKVKFVDIDMETMSLEITGSPEKIDSFIELVKCFGIIELSRTGVIALQRG